MRIVQRARHLVVHHVLGVDDTPHRIAWGVALGSLVAWTPTLGFQIMLYVAVATLARANKVSGIPILFLSNPVSAVPVYWFAWRVGAGVLGVEQEGGQFARFRATLEGAGSGAEGSVLSYAFWRDLARMLLDIGLELWVGGLVVGLLMSLPMYGLTRWAVASYRNTRGRVRLAPPESSDEAAPEAE
ncbi:MAG: DUF2062 domain-containing protein [Myxococcota bacterium]